MIRRNFSRKRQAILGVLQATDTHPTAEWVYQALKPSYPNLSLGTVYRNLTRFREDGLIVSVGVVGGQERFDADLHPHGHFVCKRCGAVLDLAEPMPLGAEDAESVAPPGAQVESFELLLRGICPNCLKGAQVPSHKN